MTQSLSALACLLLVVSLGRADEQVIGIPFRPDPPFALDGDLQDWNRVPNALVLDRAAQVVWGPSEWTSPKDFSGTVWLAWRQEHLYVAAKVTDDQLRQTQHGRSIWKGDHVELYLDVAPDLEPTREIFGAGQFQLGFSPGNFLKTGDALADCRPEAYCFRPEGTSAEGIELAAQPQTDGWTIEAAIPWKLLGVTRPAKGMVLRFEVALSDTDSPEAKQGSLMTTSTATWAHRRSRLTPAALAGSDGVPAPMVRRVAIADEVRLQQGKKKTVQFEAPEIPEGRDAVLALKARLHSPKVAGHTPGLRLTLNDQVLEGRRCLNRPLRVRSRGGRVYSMYAGSRLTTYYCPDFTSADRDQYYGLLEGVKACDFELRVTDLLKTGQNVLVIENAAAASVKNELVVAEVRLEFRLPPPPEKAKAGPPTGPLAVIEPRAEHRTRYEVRRAGEGRLEIRVGGQAFAIESRFSTPKPGWVTGSNDYFSYERKIEQRPEAIIVRDRFTNRTGENLPLRQRHEASVEGGLKRVWLGGLEQPSGRGVASESANPSSFGATDRQGLGLLPLSDVFRVHITSYALDGKVGIADDSFVLGPKATATAEWAVIPTDAPDYWRFLNAARRLLDVNFTLDGGFAFLRADPLTEPWSDKQTADFIRFKDAKYVCASITYPRYKGRIPHGTAFQGLNHANFRKAFERRRRLVPGVQNLVYFHCFLDVLDEAPEEYADSRCLRPDGKQGDYGKPYMRLFFPTESNSYGRAIGRNVDIILNEIGAEGVYWDEHEYSRYKYHYGEPWDGVSGDIDAKTMKITRLKSAVTLLSESWRLKLARRIMDHGPLIGNGAPHTQAMRALKFPCFVETGSITNCSRAQLYSPIALGDHLTERSELDAYGTMLAALDYGCVYHWYNDLTVIPTHHHLTRYMYPITPLELHAGYIIGRERIITKKSGLLGWGDDSKHEVHVFNDEGREVEDFKAPLIRREGKTYTELRIGEDWSAAIVRTK